MNRWPRLASLLVFALLFFAALASRAQMAKPEAKEPPRALVSIYRIAPGKHLDFLKWLAETEAIAKEAGVPASQLYAHTDGDSWDYLNVGPDLSKEQQAKVDVVGGADDGARRPQKSRKSAAARSVSRRASTSVPSSPRIPIHS
jgi:hypothetical protein